MLHTLRPAGRPGATAATSLPSRDTASAWAESPRRKRTLPKRATAPLGRELPVRLRVEGGRPTLQALADERPEQELAGRGRRLGRGGLAVVADGLGEERRDQDTAAGP